MPILNGFDAAKAIRALPSKLESSESIATTSTDKVRRSKELNDGNIPIFAVSASLLERQREEMVGYGMDGWILKPIDFKRLRKILRSILDSELRSTLVYEPGCNWEEGGWFKQDKIRWWNEMNETTFLWVLSLYLGSEDSE